MNVYDSPVLIYTLESFQRYPMIEAIPDVYLKDLYRNYMEIPLEDKRVIHSVFFLPELIK